MIASLFTSRLRGGDQGVLWPYKGWDISERLSSEKEDRMDGDVSCFLSASAA